jgi:prepilin-type N-terminal cleavage/methylation domain-containing protein
MLTKWLNNEKGLTLIELLVTLVLFSIIGSIVYVVLMSGMNAEKRIHTEALIRDEADIVMTKFINVLYPALSSQVSVKSQNVLHYDDGKDIIEIGFVNQQAKIDGVSLSSKGFDFSGSTISKEQNTVKIKLEVKSSLNNADLTLESQFSLLGGAKDEEAVSE